MSHDDSLDEETKQILKDMQSQETHSNDSKESNKSKKYPDKHITITYDDDGFETNTKDTPDSEW